MWYENAEDNEAGRDFQMRLQAFRYLEGQCLAQTGDPTIASEAWRLLPDLERAYCARSYSACFCLTCAMIEIHLRRVTGLKGKFGQMLKAVGLEDELQWLLVLRNDIMHGNPNLFVKYVRMPEDEEVLETYCIRAFVALHTMAIRVQAATIRPL